eukprot:TRINITY_DN5458_c0_g1_i6.p1 TRINITY_DN5458_c0_g1~~TRINITY_DN5458_c0_g1_i6.p1  ORF type:complete len:309 (+),score=42.12 TRINITY_DN5458_c0_g1_i6:29-955(+)
MFLLRSIWTLHWIAEGLGRVPLKISQHPPIQNQRSSGINAEYGQVYNLKIKDEESSDEEPWTDSFQCTENGTEDAHEKPEKTAGPTNQFNVYDKYQRAEDEEIGHLSQRMPEKRVNAKVVASHHQVYSCRNKGKQDNETRPIYNRPYKAIDPLVLLDQDEDYCYGLVTEWFGDSHGNVFCWKTGQVYLCSVAGKLRRSCKTMQVEGVDYPLLWPSRGSVVVVKRRPYQLDRAEILTAIHEDAYKDLVRQQILVSLDPVVMLPKELFFKILSHLVVDQIKILVCVELPTWGELVREYLSFVLQGAMNAT